MTRTVATIDAATPVAPVLKDYFGARQKFRAYPVVASGRLVGIIDRALLDRAQAENEHAPVGTLFAQSITEVALPGETCRNVAARLAVKGLDRVPVVEDEKCYRLIGIVSRHDLLKPSPRSANANNSGTFGPARVRPYVHLTSTKKQRRNL